MQRVSQRPWGDGASGSRQCGESRAHLCVCASPLATPHAPRMALQAGISLKQRNLHFLLHITIQGTYMNNIQVKPY